MCRSQRARHGAADLYACAQSRVWGGRDGASSRCDFVACTTQEVPVYVSVRLNDAGEATIVRTPFAYAPSGTTAEAGAASDGAPTLPLPSPPCVAAFDRSGERLYVGDRVGNLFICDVATRTVRACERARKESGGRRS